MTNFACELSDAASEASDRPAVKLDDLVLSYAQLDAAVACAAGMLRGLGVRAGDRVAVQLPNVPHFPILAFAAWRIGAVLVPMNPLLKTDEVTHQPTDSGARVIVTWPGLADAAHAACAQTGARCIEATASELEALLTGAQDVDEVIHRDDRHPAVIIYTSGPTGTPKGATLTHGNLAATAEAALERVDAGPQSIAVGVPTMFSALLHDPRRDGYDTSTLEFSVSGGASLPLQVLRGFEDELPKGATGKILKREIELPVATVAGAGR